MVKPKSIIWVGIKEIPCVIIVAGLFGWSPWAFCIRAIYCWPLLEERRVCAESVRCRWYQSASTVIWSFRSSTRSRRVVSARRCVSSSELCRWSRVSIAVGTSEHWSVYLTCETPCVSVLDNLHLFYFSDCRCKYCYIYIYVDIACVLCKIMCTQEWSVFMYRIGL